MIETFRNAFFNYQAARATNGRSNSPWSAAIYRTTRTEKERTIRMTDQFVVIENGHDTLYYDRDPGARKRRYGMRDNGTQTYSYRNPEWITRYAQQA